MLKIIIYLLACFFIICRGQLLLNSIPFQFSMDGNVTYTPSSGGIAIPGYKLKVGFNKHQWIGVKFMELTSSSNYDVLVFQRSTTSVGGFYECKVSQFYLASGRQNTLMSDTINNMDKQTTSFSASNHFELEIYRTKGNTGGQDWQGSDFTQICFFTSDSTFSRTNWSPSYQTCYGFSTTNYVSQWLGYQIKSSAYFDGVQSQIYGGFSGPELKFNFHVFRPNPTLSNAEVIIRIGGQVGAQVGYDYQKCIVDKGDYFGYSTSALKQDLIYSGYNDNDCSVTVNTNTLILHFSRQILTYDDFDKTIGSTFQICLIVGSNQNCYTISPKITFPQMSIESAIKIYERHLLIYMLSFLIIFIITFF